jgi:t-SNARE complex subunit (syntaxin)
MDNRNRLLRNATFQKHCINIIIIIIIIIIIYFLFTLYHVHIFLVFTQNISGAPYKGTVNLQF